MKAPELVYYHMHSWLSNGTTNIDSITDYKDYIFAAQKCGSKALGISEHGNIFEWVHKKEAIEKAGMKYIHCIEAYLTENEEDNCIFYEAKDMLYNINVSFEKYNIGNDGKYLVSVKRDDYPVLKSDDTTSEYVTLWIDETTIKKKYNKTRDNYHCILIAKNYDGVKELNKMVSRSYNRNDHHLYYAPRITIKELFQTSDNIIITTACLGGILHNGNNRIRELFITFLKNNKHRCFLEIQHHNINEQIEYNKYLYTLSKTIGVPLIVGTDTHALNEEHMIGRHILQKSKRVTFANEDAWDLKFKTPEELVEAYKRQNSLPIDVIYEAMQETVNMANMVEEFTLDCSAKYPKLYENSEQVFKEKINKGVIFRGINKHKNRQEYYDRIHYEYDTYKHNNAIDFMLLEEDYKSEMRKRGIRFGYSRGSVSGSIIAYLLGITDVDSVKYNLNFERFMNKERVSLADIDTDWYSEDRTTVKDYLYTKDGLYCCDIVTFNTIALKGAIRDIIRGLYNINVEKLDIPLELKEKIKKWEKSIEGHDARDTNIKMPVELEKEFNKCYNRGATYKYIPYDYMAFTNELVTLAEENEGEARKKYPEIFKYVDLVNGVVVSVGNHPAGCVVSPYPVDEWFGVFTTATNEYPISFLNMKEIDSLNFVKLDILGLDNVGLIYKTCDLANIPYATPDNIPPDDEKVWKSIQEDTTLIFQWESPSATAYLKQLFSDETISKIRAVDSNFSYMNLLSIGNGAIRPAGESYRDKLASGEYKSYNNKELDEFMKPTLGYMVYQEQIIEFLHKFCGFTMGEADVVRRCVDENSLITTGCGYQIPIKDLKPGDKVISYNENGYSEIDTVNKVFDNGVQECYSVKTTNCNELVCTKTHKVLTQDGFKQVSELSKDDWVMVPSRIVCDSDGLRPNQRLSSDIMFMIGLLIGDGSLHLDSPSYVNHEIELIEKYKHCVQKLSKSKEKCEFIISEAEGKTVDKVYTVRIVSGIYKDALINFLNKLNLRKPSIEKSINNDIMSYPADEKLSNFLAGLFNSDGGYNTKSVSLEYNSISKKLVYQIKCLLLKYGIYSYVTKAIVKGYNYYSYVLHVSHLESLIVFENEILKYMIGKKKMMFNTIINLAKNTKTFDYMLPPKCKDEICAASLMSSKSIRLLSLDSMYDLEIKKKYPSITNTKAEYFASRLYCPDTYKMLTADYIPLKVKSITPVGERHVYDIEVSKNHNYIADGIIVHNCFAKKTGTENVIPTIKDGGYLNENHYIKGFIKTMKDDYGVEKDESERLIVDFLQVIIDASDYLFSKNHADPYSWIGYICGYLRYYYPIEFITTALNIFASKENKSLSIINYAKKQGIRISSIKFRHSIADYGFDKETNTIFKGIASIKYMNAQVAKEMYELRNNNYDSFVDLLYDLSEKTTLNSRQLKILIDLDFFEEFGDANYLMKLYEYFDYFSGRCQIRKDVLEKDGIDVELVKSCSGKESTYMFTKLDSNKLLHLISTEINYKKRTLSDKINAQLEHLGYIDITSDSYGGLACVISVDTKYAPKLKMYSLKNGTTLECKIDRKTYNCNKLFKGDIVMVSKTKIKPKVKRNEDGNYVEIDGTSELWITSYKVMKNL